MKKHLLTVAIVLFSAASFAQSLNLKSLSQLVHRSDVETYLTSKVIGFTRANAFSTIVIYIKNGGTPNEEKITYDKRGIGYDTNNSAYMRALMKQIKYPLILKDDDKQHGSIFYQYGNTHMRITINLYNKPGKSHDMSIVEE